jgi:hypothetical protein
MIVVGVVASASLVLSGVAPASASPALGNDAGWPQCNSPLPPSPAFAAVGVNNGVANTTNPCFANELAWAATATGGSTQPTVSLYVNTANPALKGAWWPSANATQPATPGAPRTPTAVKNPHGICTHVAGAACAFVYGYSMAKDDATLRGVANPGSYHWWLDVETANTWQSDQAANRAALEGMAVYFASIGATVGIYSTPSHWVEIAGTVSTTSPLAKLPSWRALGTVSQAAATQSCGLASFTPLGRLTVTQFVANGLDYDVACLKLTSAPTPHIHGSLHVGRKLSITRHTWKPGTVKLTYRWYRNGAPIAHATHSTYTVKKADAGKKLTIGVTGKRTEYSTVVKVSAAKKIKK